MTDILIKCWFITSLYLLCFIKIIQADVCSLNTGRSGDGCEITLRLYKCSKASELATWNCGGLDKEVKLVKGVTVYLGYTLNGYEMTGKYSGVDVCVFWHRLDQTITYMGYTSTKKFTKSQSSCFKNGFTDVKYATYLMDATCETQGCTQLYYSLKFQAIHPDLGYGSKCPITIQGKSGNEEKTRIDVWDCIRLTRGNDACGEKPKRSGILLRKGELTNLGYNVNDYAVMAKFFGEDVCVSYREYTRSSDVSRCEEKCFSIYEDGGVKKETYRTTVTCSSISCSGSYESLKFVMTAGGRIVQSVPVFLTIVLSIVITLVV